MDVKERRLRIGLAPMLFVGELTLEADMDYIGERRFEVLEAPVARSKFAFSEFGIRCATALGLLFLRRPDLTCLNERLRRDAGIDEHELELDAVRRAPLIR